MFRVLVACYGKWDTCSELPYILKKGGCTVDIFCAPDSWLLANSYYDNWIDAGIGDLIYKERLVDLVANVKYDWVVLGDDLLINFMNKQIVEKELFLKLLPLIKIENRQMLSSKIGLSNFCIANQIDTPGFLIYNSKDDLEKIQLQLNFPIVNKLDFSFGGTDMFISRSFEEFQLRLHEIPENNYVLIQEFIEGEEIPVEALFYKGELVTYFSANVLQYSTTSFSYTTRRKYYNNEALRPILINLGKILGLNGFANMLYIYHSKTNKYYLIEVDPRPNSWMASSKQLSKNDFSAGVKRIVNGDYLNGYQGMNLKKPEIELALFYKDFRRALWNKDTKAIARWVFNLNRYWRLLPFYDMKLSKRIFTEIWNQIIVYKWNRLKAKVIH